MGRTACTEPQCLCKGEFYLYRTCYSHSLRRCQDTRIRVILIPFTPIWNYGLTWAAFHGNSDGDWFSQKCQVMYQFPKWHNYHTCCNLLVPLETYRHASCYWRQLLGFDVTRHEIPSAKPGTLRHSTYQHHLERDDTHDKLAAEEVELEQWA